MFENPQQDVSFKKSASSFVVRTRSLPDDTATPHERDGWVVELPSVMFRRCLQEHKALGVSERKWQRQYQSNTHMSTQKVPSVLNYAACACWPCVRADRACARARIREASRQARTKQSWMRKEPVGCLQQTQSCRQCRLGLGLPRSATLSDAPPGVRTSIVRRRTRRST